ncbi:flagellar basal body P-ring formation chaperone FlgA [Azospirillum sp. SYSU D00513]|uniref:flagellar basal body P-ring formation chaperone FlgA n=1 Tax=Azospirillum sp. SYSU D00513 TaxID=2812561 RepID=UPI001A95ACEF|nr:flagellar basal body P-ring formation chaperone FlgA [Azospirillum sp. SYSU D00513]
MRTRFAPFLFAAVVAPALLASAASASVAVEVGERLPSLVGFAPPDGEFEIDWSRVPPANGTLRDLSYDPIRRSVTALVELQGVTARLSGRVRLMAEVPVPTRTVARGEVIADSDLSTLRLDLLTVHRDVQTGRAGVAGAEARRSLPAGRPILATDIAAARDVNRHQEIDIVYENNGVVIATKGRAMESGNLGDVIRVQPTGVRKIIDARISGPGAVTVGAPG